MSEIIKTEADDIQLLVPVRTYVISLQPNGQKIWSCEETPEGFVFNYKPEDLAQAGKLMLGLTKFHKVLPENQPAAQLEFYRELVKMFTAVVAELSE